jgi:hypothetical protein
MAHFGETMHHAKLVIALGLAIIAAVPVASHARITRIEIDRVESPTLGGATFGRAGQYEKLVGRAYGELDPADALHRNIVYIDKAPRNAANRVEYSMDVYILKPIDMSRGNRTLFYDVVNRGSKRAFAVFHVGASTGNDPATAQDAGDGFLLKQGYTLVASGWQGDVPPGDNRLVGRVRFRQAHPYGRRGLRQRREYAPLPGRCAKHVRSPVAAAERAACPARSDPK